MKVKDLIKQLNTIHPEADVVLFDGAEGKVSVAGISVNDNDDDVATEIAICDAETILAFS